MGVLDNVSVGLAAENTVTVTSDMTAGHFVANMPQVYCTPMMVLHMEMASGFAQKVLTIARNRRSRPSEIVAHDAVKSLLTIPRNARQGSFAV
jgi:hypothetical protein